jgi:hypothetical protein
MSIIARKLRGELAGLSETDRAALAHFLIDSLSPGRDADAEEGWDAELGRRGRGIKAGRARGELASKVFSELREKHS